VKNKYLRHARISEREFRSILELFCADVEALKARRLAKVNKNTSHRIYGLLRRRVVELANAEAVPFARCVEVDESYFGPRRVRGIHGRGAVRKIPVVGLLKRGGRVICSPLPNCSKAELLKVIKGHVSPANEIIIFTDEWRGCEAWFSKATSIIGFTTALMNSPGDAATPIASSRFGATPKPGWPDCEASAPKPSFSTSRKQNGVSITDRITFAKSYSKTSPLPL
jgi:transposase-like protein